MNYLQSAVVGDAVADDTIQLTRELKQVAANGGCLVLPPTGSKYIRITAPIQIVGTTYAPFSVMGAGPQATRIGTDYVKGWVLWFSGCHNMHLQNFGIVANAPPTAGELLSIDSSSRVSLDHVSIYEGFVNLWLGNMVGSTFNRVFTGGGTNWKSSPAGSANLIVDQYSAGTNNGLSFFNCDFEGGLDGSNRYQTSVVVNNADGVWFHGGHIFGGSAQNVLLSSNPALTEVEFHGTYIEKGAQIGMLLDNSGKHLDSVTVSGCNFNGAVAAPLAFNGQVPRCVITNNRGVGNIPAQPSSAIVNNLP